MEAKVQTVINWFDNSLSDQFKIPLCDKKERSDVGESQSDSVE